MLPKKVPGITILGLGPGNPKLLTLEALDFLNGAQEIYLRTRHHPTVDTLNNKLEIHSFDNLYDQLESFDQVYEHIIQSVITLGKRMQGVVYAVPGHPFVAEATTPEIVRRARLETVPCQVIDGISFIEPVFTVLELDPFPTLLLLDALELNSKLVLPFSPNTPVIIAQIYSRMIANEVKLSLGSVYPDEYAVKLVHDAGAPSCEVEEISLYEIDRSERIGLRTILYLPPLPDDTSFEALQEVVARLRAPNGCPWDRKQTHQTLRQFLLEEAYELVEALDKEETEHISEELGDLLLQVLLHAQIAEEDGEFTMTEILSGIHQKIVRRHPHVFGTEHVESADGVVKTWERIKAEEKSQITGKEGAGILDHIPAVLPALSQAQEIQERAARVGFDWDSIEPVFEKVKEEFEEIKNAQNQAQIDAEIGDLIFAVVNLARWLRIDAETALREANTRFKKRFSYIENRAKTLDRRLEDMTLQEMDIFWEEAKNGEKDSA